VSHRQTPSLLLDRVAAAQSAVDRFNNAELIWGRQDCARLAAHVLRELGHNAALARFGDYRSAGGAARALKRRGFADLAAVMDGFGLPRIPPASALPGDVLGFGHDDQSFGLSELRVTLAVALGNGRILGFLENLRCHVVTPDLAQDADYFAWRVDPWRS